MVAKLTNYSSAGVVVPEVVNGVRCALWVLEAMLRMLFRMLFRMLLCMLLCILEGVEGEFRLLEVLE